MSEISQDREKFWSMARIVDVPLESTDLNLLASEAFGLEVNMGSRFDEWQIVKGVEFGGKVIGLGTYLQIPVTAGTILYEDLKVVLPEYQGLGIGSRISHSVLTVAIRANPGQVHFLARTQNEQEFLSVRKSCGIIKPDALVVPLEANPGIEDMAILSQFLIAHPPKRGYVDLDNFIHEGAYKTYPDMTVGVRRKVSIALVEEYLNRFGMSRQSGDALYLLVSNISS